MKYEFDTEKEAQDVLDEARDEWKYFCPVTKDLCRGDCISYHEGSIYDNSPTSKAIIWQVSYPFCSNVLISGEITANVIY